MDDQNIKDDLHDMRSSSLAIPTGMKALSAEPDSGAPSVAMRVGVTGAICDLEDEGRLDEILPLLAKEQELTSELGRDELQLRRCHDHRWMLRFIRSHRGRGIKKALESLTERLQVRKNAHEMAFAEVQEKLSDADPRLGERIQPIEVSALPVQPPPTRMGRRRLQPEVAARNEVIARFVNSSDRELCRELDFAFPYDKEHDCPAPQLPSRWFSEGAKTYSQALLMFPNRVHRLISGARRLCRLR